MGGKNGWGIVVLNSYDCIISVWTENIKHHQNEIKVKKPFFLSVSNRIRAYEKLSLNVVYADDALMWV